MEEPTNPPKDGETHGAASLKTAHAYWRANLKLLGILLSIWFVVSFGAGILLVDMLNQFSLFGVPLGFWFAQQGSIYVFVVLIFIYSWQIQKIEKRFGVDDA